MATSLDSTLSGLLSSPAMQLGAGLLAASGYSRTPRSLGAALGKGYAAAQALHSRALQNEMLNARVGFYRSVLPRLIGAQHGAAVARPGASRSASGGLPPSAPPLGFASPAAPQAASAQGAPVQASAPQNAPSAASGLLSPGAGDSIGPEVNRAVKAAFLGGLLGIGTGAEKMALQYDPNVARTMALAKEGATDPLSYAITRYKQANASGDATDAQIWKMKIDQLSGRVTTSSWNGLTEVHGPNGAVLYMFNPRTGEIYTPQNGYTLGRGYLSTHAQKSAAEEVGKELGQFHRVVNEKGAKYEAPGISLAPGLLGALEGHSAQPNAGARGAVLTSGPAAPSGVPTGGAHTAPTQGASTIPLAPPATLGPSTLPGVPFSFQTGLAPAKERLANENAESAGDLVKEANATLTNAQAQNTQIDTILNDAKTFQPGQFAGVRQKALEWLYSTGVISQAQRQELGSAQEGTKISIQLQALATHTLGNREAAQIFQWIGKSIPGLTLSADGLSKIGSFMKGMNDYKMAVANSVLGADKNLDTNGVNDAQNQWVKNSNPLYFIMSEMPQADRVEFLRNMGAKRAEEFGQKWSAAIRAGYAPEPQADGG